MGADCSKTHILITRRELNLLSNSELQIIHELYNLNIVPYLNDDEIEERTSILVKGSCGSRFRLPHITIQKLQGY